MCEENSRMQKLLEFEYKRHLWGVILVMYHKFLLFPTLIITPLFLWSEIRTREREKKEPPPTLCLGTAPCSPSLPSCTTLIRWSPSSFFPGLPGGGEEVLQIPVSYSLLIPLLSSPSPSSPPSLLGLWSWRMILIIWASPNHTVPRMVRQIADRELPRMARFVAVQVVTYLSLANTIH